MKQKFIDLFFYCGVGKKKYEETKNSAFISNLKMWKSLYFLGLVVFSLMIIESIFVNNPINETIFYSILSIYFLIMVCLNKVLIYDNPILQQLFMYVTAGILLAFGIRLGLIRPQMMAVTFTVLLVFIPMLIIDKPYRMSLLLISFTTIYLVHASFVKTQEAFQNDVANTILFGVLGILINIFYNSIRFKEFELKNRLEKQRDTDELTGLSNKNGLIKGIDELIKSSNENGIMIFLDIDNFKEINDNYGHSFGDIILHDLGIGIDKIIETKSVKGRFGGDEFIIYLENEKDINVAINYANQLIKYSNNNLHTPNYNDRIEISIGIAPREQFDRDYDTIFKRADKAMYEAKRVGKNNYIVYSDGLDY